MRTPAARLATQLDATHGNSRSCATEQLVTLRPRRLSTETVDKSVDKASYPRMTTPARKVLSDQQLSDDSRGYPRMTTPGGAHDNSRDGNRYKSTT